MNVHIGWPQAIWIFLAVVSLVTSGVLNGRPRTDKHSALLTTFVIALEFGLLYWGGFFK